VLLDAMPVPDPTLQRERRERQRRRRASSRPVEITADACPFTSRCPHAIDICGRQRPPLEPTPHGTVVACHRWREIAPSPEQGSAELVPGRV
jgi:peptide/nickel transport system ATP-binding protein